MSESKTIRLSSEIHRRLKLAAFEAGKTLQEYMESLLDAALPKHDLFDGVPIRRYSKADIAQIVQEEEEEMKNRPELLAKADRNLAKTKTK